MSKQAGLNEAIKLAIAQLAKVGFVNRCEKLGLPKPKNGKIELKLFGSNMIFHINDFSLTYENGKPAKPADLTCVIRK